MLDSRPTECPKSLLDAVNGRPPVRTGVVNAVSTVVLESVRDAVEAGVIEPVLFGDSGEIAKGAATLGWDMPELEVVDAADEGTAALLAAQAAGRGEVAALMKGHVHTDVFMRAVLNRDAGLRTGKRLSHIFHMTVPGRDGRLLISDAALNTHPDIDTKKAIIGNVVTLAGALGLERPKVALLSATEEPNEHMPSSMDAVQLAEWAKTEIANADVQGPLAFDLAVSPDAARIKGVEGPVVGRADAVVVPDIVTGNSLFKMMVYYMAACAGGLVMGAKVPVLLTSRADPPPARLASACLAALAVDAEA